MPRASLTELFSKGLEITHIQHSPESEGLNWGMDRNERIGGSDDKKLNRSFYKGAKVTEASYFFHARHIKVDSARSFFSNCARQGEKMQVDRRGRHLRLDGGDILKKDWLRGITVFVVATNLAVLPKNETK